MEFEAIKTDRLYVKVAAQISSLIESGQIKVGDKLPSERDLAEKLKVSRPTVREAMIVLELSGAIEIRTGAGIFVLDKQPKLIVKDKGVGPFEILESRQLIEVKACELAAERITNEQIEKLKIAVEEMRAEQLAGTTSEKADWKFHYIIAEATQNSAILKIVNWLWELRNQSLLSVWFSETIRKEGVHPSLDEHEAIIKALEKRDSKAAAKAMSIHIENATKAAANRFENK